MLACAKDTLDNGHPWNKPRGPVFWLIEVMPDAVTRSAVCDPFDTRGTTPVPAQEAEGAARCPPGCAAGRSPGAERHPADDGSVSRGAAQDRAGRGPGCCRRPLYLV